MPKLLIIEDELSMAHMYRDKFIGSGFDVSVISSSEEALEKIKDERPDLILLDMLLPLGNGVYFLREMRKMADKKIAKTPVIVLSNYDEPDTRKEANDLGIKDYLLKTDFTPRQLVEEIKRLYGER
jgi:DNA-binding response OmpR family regulator